MTFSTVLFCFLIFFSKVSSGGNTGVMANSVNPGVVNTEVLRHYPLLMRCLFKFIGLFFFKASKIVLGCFHKVI